MTRRKVACVFCCTFRFELKNKYLEVSTYIDSYEIIGLQKNFSPVKDNYDLWDSVGKNNITDF